MFKKGIVRFSVTMVAVVLCASPALSSAQTFSLSPQARAELGVLAEQLVQILSQLSQAAAQGPSYTNSAAFQSVANSIAAQLSQVQSRVLVLFSGQQTQYQPPYTPYVPPTTYIPPTTYVPPVYPFPTAPPYGQPTSSLCPVFTRDLESGMQGGDVILLQQFLARNTSSRFTGTVNGIFDPATLSAVQNFQVAYGVVSFGAYGSGFGRVGPRTREAIRSVCLTEPPTPQTPVPTIPPVSSGYSTGSISIASYTGGITNAINATVIAQPNSTCSATRFTVQWGDGQSQHIDFPASCSSQQRTVSHTYNAQGTYTVSLTSGSFSITKQIAVPIAGTGTLALFARKGSVSNSIVVSATGTASTNCDAFSYTLYLGDGTERTMNFGATCVPQQKTIEHTYSQSGMYTISAIDSGKTTYLSIPFEAAPVASAGAGDLATVLRIQGEGASGTAIVDTSRYARALTSQGGVRLDGSAVAIGQSSVYFPGAASYVSTSAHSDLNVGSGNFTLALWFKVASFPGNQRQATLVAQSDATAADATLGGYGLVLYGDKLYYIGNIGGTARHPIYGNSIGTGSLRVGEWYHAAVVRSGSSLKMYLNGVGIGAVTVTGGANAPQGALTFGRYGDYQGNYFYGWLDEVEISKGVARWTTDFDPNAYYGIGNSDTLNFTVSSTGLTTTVSVTRTAGSACAAASYKVLFGDGNEQTLSFDATCAQQTKTATRTYAAAGTYTGSVRYATSGIVISTFTATVAPSTTTTTTTTTTGQQNSNGDDIGIGTPGGI